MDIRPREGPFENERNCMEGDIEAIDRIMKNKLPVSVRDSAANISNEEMTCRSVGRVKGINGILMHPKTSNGRSHYVPLYP